MRPPGARPNFAEPQGAFKTMQLGLAFDKNWETVRGASPALMRKGRSNNNALQFSFNQNIDEKIIEPAIDLGGVVQSLVARLGGQFSNAIEGPCEYGRFASAAFVAGGFSHCQVWCITNEIHIITATFICDGSPTENELLEVEKMVMSLRLVPDSRSALPTKSPRWQLWKRG